VDNEKYIDSGTGLVYWGKQASGVLPIAKDTKQICLNLRSNIVSSIIDRQRIRRQCWGTFGGALEGSPESNAKNELKQETGYNGPLELFPAFHYKDGAFEYFNFIGLVPRQEDLMFNPEAGSSWESSGLDWFPAEEIVGQNGARGYRFHDGPTALLSDGKSVQIIKNLTRVEESTARSFLLLFKAIY
jgi:8-oxo-dGTP pyrophosphatase MutT (NUDIX family)